MRQQAFQEGILLELEYKLFGIDLSALSLLAGALGVGIGFGFQKVTDNLISGLTILVEEPIKVGDRVEVVDVDSTVGFASTGELYFKYIDNTVGVSSYTSKSLTQFYGVTGVGKTILSGETIEGANSGATGIVKGKYSTTQVYVQETNNGTFEVGETIRGISSRATANISSYSRQPINGSWRFDIQNS